jgi:hypothetical protein
MSSKPWERESLFGSVPDSSLRHPPTPISSPAARRTRRVAEVTSTPDIAPPKMLCPECDHPLAYRKTVTGGVKPIERWHYFSCQTCGGFVYRDRTRKLRPAVA